MSGTGITHIGLIGDYGIGLTPAVRLLSLKPGLRGLICTMTRTASRIEEFGDRLNDLNTQSLTFEYKRIPHFYEPIREALPRSFKQRMRYGYLQNLNQSRYEPVGIMKPKNKRKK